MQDHFMPKGVLVIYLIGGRQIPSNYAKKPTLIRNTKVACFPELCGGISSPPIYQVTTSTHWHYLPDHQ